jgi:hypothetical protein
MKNLVAVFAIGLWSYSAQAQAVWCSTVIEDLESGERNVGFSIANTPTPDMVQQGLGSADRLGAVQMKGANRMERTVGMFRFARQNRENQNSAPNIFTLTFNQGPQSLAIGASLDDLARDQKVGASGANGLVSDYTFWAGRARYKSVPEQYLSSELYFSYNTGKEFIEHQCRVCSPKMGTCPDYEDPKALEKEALKLNATLVEAKLF